MRRSLLAGCFAVLAAQAALAQTARISVERGPHYVGDALRIRVSAEGFEEEPLPEVDWPAPTQGRLAFVGASPSVNESITIVNGRVTRTREVTHVYEYRFTADAPGQVSLGPIRVSQGTLERRIPVLRLEIRDVPTSEDIAVVVQIPEGPFYVGQRVPVTLVMRIERELQRNLQGYTLRVPLFDMNRNFRLLVPEDPGTTELRIESEAGPVEVAGRAREEPRGSGRDLVVRVERTLVPLGAGTHEIPPASLVVNEGTAFRRDLFGGRVAMRARKWRVTDQPRELVVKPVPRVGRPESFGGAVGRGFTLEVAADRTVVQVGDPIALTLTLRGEGLETASLPPLNAAGLLPRDRFRVPEGELAGLPEGDAKRFSAVVRVLDENVEEIPRLAYAWFDPTTERFETTHSQPIAVAVRAAHMVGAADVERAEAPELAAASAIPEPAPASGSRALPLTGAELAIERDPTLLLRDASAGPAGPWAGIALYAGGLLLVAYAWLDRRRRDLDPALVRRRRILAAELRRVRAATRLTGDRALEEIADALRRMRAEVPERRDPEIDRLLAECDTRRFAPPGAERSADEALVRRAEALARRFAEGAA